MIDGEIKKEEKKNCKNSYYKRFVEKLEGIPNKDISQGEIALGNLV